jgi:acyl-CoA oxidase
MKTDEWIIHSPTLTSTKYWAGGTGLWANYSSLFAKTIVDGNDYGVQCFIVQMRDTETR